jgi:hypothetical protein
VDAERTELPSIPRKQVEDLSARRLLTGEAELTAELLATLEKRDAMAALRRATRRLKTGRPTADDEDG